MDRRIIKNTLDIPSNSARVYYEIPRAHLPHSIMDDLMPYILAFILFGPWVIIILVVLINDFVNKRKKTADEQR